MRSLRRGIVLVLTFCIMVFWMKKRYSNSTHKSFKYSSISLIYNQEVNRKRSLLELQQKADFYITGQNLTVPKRRQPSTRALKISKQVSEVDSNYRLNRLLYQLWDPYTNENEHNMFTCQHLVSENRKIYQHGKRFARKLNKKFYEYAKLQNILDAIGPTCNNLRKLFRYQTPNFGPASYSVAYTVTLERTAEQSLRMLLSIYHHDNVYCLHPNAKFGMKYYNVFRKVSECIPNIYLPDRIFEIRVKTHNRLKAEAQCFKKMLSVPVPWKYGINLPSTVFPLYNHSKIVHYLRSKPYEVSINWKTPNEAHFMSRVQFVHVARSIEGGDRALVRTSKRKAPPPHGIKIYRKGTSFIGTRQFYEFLVNDPLAKQFLDWTRDTKNPEDFYYASLYKHITREPRSSPDFGTSGLISGYKVRPEHKLQDVSVDPENNLLISLWGSDRGHRCHGKYRGSVCILGSADLKWLLQQGYLFANSFDFRVDRLVVDCLSKNLKDPILKSL
ncbi:beta-1,3-galactosyl-O-glycosyl-glycoprotein beta-1,6-N-acetylglucosaminyltransferase 4-like [Clytia hemisphaerica]|uniref:Uncharacterized protein n=1 Tax=Clytia hemisphaerica TaxID=252671 RepID=A0A7M5UJJ9_9CNID